MKKCLILIALYVSLSTGLNAQLGLKIAPTHSLASEWQVLVENYITKRHTDFLKYGITATLDYTFQLKASEWQFSPAVHAMHSQFDYREHEFNVTTVGIQGNFNFIPFKEGQRREIPKAIFYLQISPGIDFVNMKYFQFDLESGSIINRLSDKKIAVNGGVNLLIDIKLTDLLTITPLAGIRYFPNLEWEGFSTTISNGDFQNEYDHVDWQLFSYGIRIGLNLAEIK